MASVSADDKYKIFDTGEFQSRQFLGGTITIDNNGIVIFQRHFAFKFALLLLLLMMAVALLLLFLILFGSTKTSANLLQTQVAALQAAQRQTCSTEQCLQQAAYMTKVMNSSADPCEDFYEFACGNYDNVLPYDHWLAYTDVLREMSSRALRDLEVALDKPSSSADPIWLRKVRNYYSICLEYYRTYMHQDNPLVSRLLNTTDGFADYLFGFGLGKVSIGDMFVKLSGKYYIHSLFGAFSSWNDYLHKSLDQKRYSIWVGRTTKSVGLLKYSLYFSHHEEQYTDFVKSIARLLQRDSRLQPANAEELVATFAADVLEVERKLFQIQSRSYRSEWQNANSDPVHHPNNMVEVQELNGKFSFIDFTAYLQEIYGKYEITPRTKVVMYSEHYLQELNQFFTENNATTSSVFKRKMSNYLTWVAAMFFEWDLSPEYRQKFRAIREISWYNTDSNHDESAHGFCFDTTQWAMDRALSGLYVREYFHAQDRERANTIFEELRTATKSRIDSLSWMDAETKQKSKQRVAAIMEKSGFPDEAKDDSYLNNEFRMIRPSYSDYFKLLLDSLEYKKSVQRQLLGNYDPLDLQHWGRLYDTHFNYHIYDNEILIQAGVLQAPLFAQQLPQQLVYGGFGALIAHEIVRAFDVKGQLYSQRTGYRSSGWWSQASLRQYKNNAVYVRSSMKELLEFYENDRLSSLKEEDRDKKVSALLHKEVNWTARELGAVQIALSAFVQHRQQAAGQQRLLLPAFQQTDLQMFFISYAQMNCHHMGVFHDWYNWQLNYYPWKIAVNTVLTNTPQFAKAFSCSKSARLNAEKKCQVY